MRKIDLTAGGEPITDKEIKGITSLIHQLHQSGHLTEITISIEGGPGALAAFGQSTEETAETQETTVTAETTETLEPSETEEIEVTDTAEEQEEVPKKTSTDQKEKAESGEDVTPPYDREFDEPEDEGKAWQEYFQQTGKMPSFTTDSKYADVLKMVTDTDNPITTTELVAISEDRDFDYNASQASSHLYTLLRKGFVTRTKPENGPYKYSTTELGNYAVQEEIATV